MNMWAVLTGQAIYSMDLCQSRGAPTGIIENNIDYRVIFNYMLYL